jgi:hypothetical protein
MQQERSGVLVPDQQGGTQAPKKARVAWACPACGRECWTLGERFCAGCGVELPLEVLIAVPKSFWSRSAWHKFLIVLLAASILMNIELVLHSATLAAKMRGQFFFSSLILCGLVAIAFVNRRRWIWFFVGALAIYPLVFILGKLPAPF